MKGSSHITEFGWIDFIDSSDEAMIFYGEVIELRDVITFRATGIHDENMIS